MKPVFTDEELEKLLENYWSLLSNSVAVEMSVARIVRDAVEDKIVKMGDVTTPSAEHLREHPWKKEGWDYGHLAVEIDDDGNPTGRTGRLKNILTGEVTWDDE